MASEWNAAHCSASSIPQDLNKPFTLNASSGTDLWRSSETKDASNAPAYYRIIESSKFKRIAVTISADWKDLYDQGGILFMWPKQKKWIKAGVELVNHLQYSCVTCDRYSDWSLHPINNKAKLRIEAVRDGDALWIIADGVRIREPKFAFLEERRGDEELWIGVTAAKPSKEGSLEVTFEDLVIELL